MAKAHYKSAQSAVRHAIERHRLRLPTDKPIIRITFDQEPNWQLLALVEAFDHDAFFVFRQALSITDAYYGCFEADFEPSDKTAGSLNFIAQKVVEKSDFDDLIAKYRIVSVRLFNFPSLPSAEIVVNYSASGQRPRTLYA